MKSIIDKFIKKDKVVSNNLVSKNKELVTKLNNYIDKNSNNITQIIVSFVMYEIIKDLPDSKFENDVLTYKKFYVIPNPFVPVNSINFLFRDSRMLFKI